MNWIELRYHGTHLVQRLVEEVRHFRRNTSAGSDGRKPQSAAMLRCHGSVHDRVADSFVERRIGPTLPICFVLFLKSVNVN